MTNPIIKTIRHAMSIDERRCFFRQNLWGKPYPHQDVQQVWFAGVHSDVGGSYPESKSGLAQITLEWIIEEARGHGLVIRASRYAEVVPKRSADQRRRIPPPAATREDSAYVSPNPNAEANESLHGAWWIPEFLPQRNEFTNRWHIPLGRRRYIEVGSAIHQSVIDRIEGGSYNPPNLPSQYTVVPWSNRVE